MTFQSTVTVEFGDKSGLNDISDRVQGAQISTRLRTGDFGLNRAVITLRNNDGALTPGAGGTYDGLDWFAQGLFIEGDTGSYTFTLFHGIITDFRLQDDGVNSSVVLEADDGYTVGGGSATTFSASNASGISSPLNVWIEETYNGVSFTGGSISGVQMPKLANTTSSVDVVDVGVVTGVPTWLTLKAYDLTAPARDFVRQSLMPQNPNVAWPTTIDLSTTNTLYESTVAPIYPLRASGTAITFTFAETATAGELPFGNLQRGFPIDALLNEAVLTSLPDTLGVSTSATSTDTVSAEKYGSRSIQATQVIVNVSSGPNDYLPTSINTCAQRWSHTYSSSEFIVREFSVTEAMVRAAVGTSATSEEKWAQLLDIESGPLQQGSIEFTPAGGSSAVTELFVTMSRTIQVTPADIRLTVECLPLDQTGAFILDSSTLGVLDQNRLG